MRIKQLNCTDDMRGIGTRSAIASGFKERDTCYGKIDAILCEIGHQYGDKSTNRPQKGTKDWAVYRQKCSNIAAPFVIENLLSGFSPFSPEQVCANFQRRALLFFTRINADVIEEVFSRYDALKSISSIINLPQTLKNEALEMQDDCKSAYELMVVLSNKLVTVYKGKGVVSKMVTRSIGGLDTHLTKMETSLKKIKIVQQKDNEKKEQAKKERAEKRAKGDINEDGENAQSTTATEFQNADKVMNFADIVGDAHRTVIQMKFEIEDVIALVETSGHSLQGVNFKKGVPQGYDIVSVSSVALLNARLKSASSDKEWDDYADFITEVAENIMVDYNMSSKDQLITEGQAWSRIQQALHASLQSLSGGNFGAKDVAGQMSSLRSARAELESNGQLDTLNKKTNKKPTDED